MPSHWNWKAADLAPPPAKSSDADQYFDANRRMIRQTLNGKGPHATSASAPGIRIVFNLPVRHALSFLDQSSGQAGRGRYLNRTDVNRLIGNALGGSTLRARVDQAVCAAAKALGEDLTPDSAYYGAMELNGTGVRYFGDVCLVLQPSDDNPVMLIRNSYDLSVPPVVNDLLHLPPKKQDKKAASIAETWIGRWGSDACDMAIVKMMAHTIPDRAMRDGRAGFGRCVERRGLYRDRPR